ncbi:sulfurtransferase [Quadrisphaera sp. DSM 44207]|uniref:sulfurtransferase n=1 Tax=Quadrisphaera sp. DSM 44207 TaxID=1881057 RepID=UPI00088CD49B|nr:rhodanese-like domain-containing protein [Quadrisphaera sp. DSM 44207]SDQ09967.1 thiosulfate/3-mercaptopyruvate sulfurtransferase [Quadrisphaera sp. DSM 44207]
MSEQPPGGAPGARLPDPPDLPDLSDLLDPPQPPGPSGAPSGPRCGPDGVPPLVDAAWLAEHHDEVVLLQVDDDSASYYDVHLPGALPVATYDDLYEQVRRGPITREHFEELMQSRGVTTDDHVVLYSATAHEDRDHSTFAYWLMRLYRHPRVSVLDGGMLAWVRAGHPLQTRVPTARRVGRYTSPGRDPWAAVGRDELLARYVGSRDGTLLIDCRTPEEYRGRAHHRLDVAVERHRVSGRIPGARSLPSALLLRDTRFRSREELHQLFASRGVSATTDVALYCRTPERSATLWFALAGLLEHPRVRHYVGGWAEYGALLDVPVTRD